MITKLYSSRTILPQRWLAIAAALLIILSAACASAENTPPKLTQEDFIFTFADKPFKLQTPASALLASVRETMGEPDVVECEACLFVGADKEFSNDELVFGTYPNGPGGSDMVESILVVGGEWTTARGVGIGAERAQVEKAYGLDYVYDYNQMTYYMGDPETQPYLAFYFNLDNGLVNGFLLFNNTQNTR